MKKLAFWPIYRFISKTTQYTVTVGAMDCCCILWHIKTFAVYYMAVCNNVDWKQYSDFSLQILGVTLDSTLSLCIHVLITLLRITICKHFDIFVHPSPRKLRILWPVLLLVHDSITVTLCSTKCLTKTSTNCSEFRIVQHELSVESVDGHKMLGSYVTTCTGFLFTLGRILNWHFCVLNHMSCDNQIIWQ